VEGASPTGQVGEECDAQEDGGDTTAQIRDHRQNLAVSLIEGVPGYVLEERHKSLPRQLKVQMLTSL